MCSPTLALGAQAAGAVSQTLGAWYAAKGQQSTLRAQADALDQQSRGVMAAGEREQQRSMLQTANLKSRQRATMAANGFDMADGSNQAILNSTDMMGEIDRQTIENNAVRQAFGYQTQARYARAGADSINPWMSAVSTGLTGATQVAGSWYSFKKAGVFDQMAPGGDGLSQGQRRAIGVW